MFVRGWRLRFPSLAGFDLRHDFVCSGRIFLLLCLNTENRKSAKSPFLAGRKQISV